jgi:two-component system cell cycle sensor histidine kinase/response regulator CckA
MRLQQDDLRQPRTQGEKILLVDDDSMAGNAVRKILEHFGYEVDFWVNPVEALSHFQQDPYGFDLVVTDMTMPIMTGRELALEIMKVREDIPVIICTGYSITLSEKEGGSNEAPDNEHI